MEQSPAQPSVSAAEQPLSFGELLRHLFATHLSPNGQPYSLHDVYVGTGRKLSPAYLSLLRRGRNVGFPSADKVQALADFFGVDVSYFLRATPGAPDRKGLDPDLEQALANPEVRDIALRASVLTSVERKFFLQMLEQAYQLKEHIKASARASSVDEEEA